MPKVVEPQVKKRVKKLFAQGYSKSGIVRDTSLSWPTVKKILEEKDTQRREREIEKLYGLGFSKVEIARELGVSKPEINRVLGVNGEGREYEPEPGLFVSQNGAGANKAERLAMKALEEIQARTGKPVTEHHLYAELVMDKDWGTKMAEFTINNSLEKGLIEKRKL